MSGAPVAASATLGETTRLVRVSAMIWPRERGSPAALSLSASALRAACTATPFLTDNRADSIAMVSGAGRRLVCRSASARRRRSTKDSGSSA